MVQVGLQENLLWISAIHATAWCPGGIDVDEVFAQPQVEEPLQR